MLTAPLPLEALRRTTVRSIMAIFNEVSRLVAPGWRGL